MPHRLTFFVLVAALAGCSGLDLALIGPPSNDAGSAVDDVGNVPDLGATADVPTVGADGDIDATVVDIVVVPVDTGVDVQPVVRCGDGVCSSPRETCANCPADCHACDPCATHTTCGLCTAASACGWCTNTRECLTGTNSGPDNRACSGTQWAWQTSQCTGTDPCRVFTDCGTCTAQPTCGWCANSSHCLTGTVSGPDNGACRNSDWRPMPMNCGG